MNTTIDMKRLTLTAEVEITAAADGKKRPTVKALAYAGGKMRIAGWGPIAIDLAGLALPSTFPMLLNHDPREVLGQGGARVEDGKLLLSGLLTGNPEDEGCPCGHVVGHSRRGFKWSASVGVDTEKVDLVPRGKARTVNGQQISGPFTLLLRGHLREISLVAIGADENAEAEISARRAEGKQMDTDVQDEQTTDETPETMTLVKAQRREAIIRACAGKHSDIEAEALAGDWDENKTKLAVLRAERPVPPFTAGGGGGIATGDVIEAGLMLHAGAEKAAMKAFPEQVVSRAGDLRCRSMVDLLATHLRSQGIDPGRSVDSIIRAAFSTSSVSVALSNAMQKTVLFEYRQAPASWRSFAKPVSVTGLGAERPANMLRPSHSIELAELASDGEIQHAELGENTLSINADTYAKMTGITRKTLINDDANFLSSLPQSFAKAATRKISDLMWTMILGNANNFFHADNGNLLTGAGSALDVAALGAAVAAMRGQKDAEGNSLDIIPATLCVSENLEATAQAILSDGALARYIANDVDQMPTANPFAGKLQLAIEPRIANSTKPFAGASSTMWFVFASPVDAPMLIAFLHGKDSPIVEQTDQDFNRLGIQLRTYLDFGVAQGDSKASVRSDGV